MYFAKHRFNSWRTKNDKTKTLTQGGDFLPSYLKFKETGFKCMASYEVLEIFIVYMTQNTSIFSIDYDNIIK